MNYAQVFQSMIVCGVNGPDCNFGHLIKLALVVMDNIVVLATFLVTIAFVYIGFIFLTSGGDVGAKKKAKDTASNVLWGFILVLAAWLIVYTITSVLLKGGYSYLG